MKSYLKEFTLKSIRFKMIISIFCILGPLIALLIYYNYYAIHVIHNQIAEATKNRLIQYMRQLDTNLDVLDNELSSLAYFDNDIQILSTSAPDETWLIAASELSNKLDNAMVINRNIDCIFVYNKQNKEFIYGKNDRESFSERAAVMEYIESSLDSDPLKQDFLTHKKWFVKKIDGQYYLMKLYSSYNSYVGAWVRAKQLLASMNYIDVGKTGIALLTTTKGVPMSTTAEIEDKHVDLTKGLDQYELTGKSNQFLIVGANSSKGDFHLIMLLKDKSILEKLPILNNVITTIAFCSILLLPLSLLLLHRFVLKPLNKVLSAMKKARDGDIGIRINENDTSEEFLLLNSTFNSMLDQIHELKIHVYEERLNNQREELDRLQLQVNPHFFLNSLNIIFRLAQDHEFALIQDLSLCLLQYFRYMFRKSHKLVTIREELEHVHNYIRIQELRFTENLIYAQHAEDFVLDVRIPPLIIQNFVENAVKYAVTLDEPVHINVDVAYQTIGEKEIVKIVIQDTGNGFTPEILENLQAGQKIDDDTGEHVGAWNVQRRLELLYKGEATIAFYNKASSGAVVEIEIPYKGIDE